MRLLFTRFPLESRFGGAEVQILSLMKGLKDRGNAVHFLGSCRELLKITGDRGTELQIGPPPVTKWGAVSFLWRQFSMKRKLTSELEKLIADGPPLTAIFMVSLSEKLLLTRWAHTKGIRVIWIEHDSVGRWLTHNPWLPRLRRLSRIATTVCVSDLSAKLYMRLKWQVQDIAVIPNGISLERFLGMNEEPRAHNSRVNIGCVARLHAEKGLDLLIRSAKEIPEVSLTIIGTGPEKESLESLIGEDGDRMVIIPNVSNLSAFYVSTDVLVLPSRTNDPFGLVAGEAMMLGIPVIVTDQCGIAGYLEHDQNALVVKANSQRDLTEAIKRMLDATTRKQLSMEGKKTANRLFDVGRMVEAYELLV